MRLVWAIGLSCALVGCGAGANRERGALTPKSSAEKPALAATDDAPKPALAGQQAAHAGPWIGGGTSSEFVLSGSRQEAIAVWVDVPASSKTTHVPTALTLSIDTSGSMRGDKMRDARRAAQAVVNRLTDGDIVAIHTFSDDARVRVAPTVLTPASRRQIAAVIEELSASGATNLFDAIKVAEAETWRAPATHAVRRVVVISDGKATAGPSDANTIAQLAEVGVARGVQVSSIGVGLDYDETALNALAIRSSGRLYHLSDSAELGAIVEREIALLDKTIATDAVIEIVAAPGVRLSSLAGAHSSWSGGGTLRVPLGTLFAGQSRELAVRASIDAIESGEAAKRPLVSARLHFKDPSDGNVDRVQEIVVRATETHDANLLSSRPNDRARSVLATLEAAELAGQAVLQANAGDFRGAEQQLARAEAELKKSASLARDESVRQRLSQRAQSMAKNKTSVRAAAAAPAAKRPAAMRKSALEANDSALEMSGY